jgi:pilus assembly protein Flp/PilA
MIKYMKKQYVALTTKTDENRLAALAKDENGAALVEYGMLVGLIAVLCVAAVTTLGTTIQGYFTAINAALAG